MTMADNLTHAWRSTPLEDIIPTSRLIDDFARAGYETAGDILDADPEDLAADVYGVGLRRAELIRQKVFDHVKPFGSQGQPHWVLSEGPIVREIDAPTPSLVDTLMTVAALLGVALMVYMVMRSAL